MAKLHPRDRGPRFPFGRWLMLGLCLIGAILIALQALYNAGNYFMAWLMPLEHPSTFKFASYDTVLQQCVKGNRVDYQLLKSKNLLQPALNDLSRVSPDKLKDPTERIAYWANAYNLLVLKTIADRYPVNNVRSIARALSLQKFVVGGKPYSVEDIQAIEIGSLINTFDPRTVFLLCGGTIGYPSLMNHALQATTLQEDMDKATTDFINNPQNVYLDADTYTFYLSRLFKWYEEPFSRVFKTPADLANAYLPADKQVNLADGHLKIRYIQDFNWQVNDLSAVPVPSSTSPAGDTP